MNYKVVLSRNALKNRRKIPKHILDLFETWVELIEEEGIFEMQMTKGYREHALKGDRSGQRSSSLNRSWRIIYRLEEITSEVIVEVLEINHHDY